MFEYPGIYIHTESKKIEALLAGLVIVQVHRNTGIQGKIKSLIRRMSSL